MEANSKEKPLISIALCTFNGERYLSKQLDSIFAQTYKALEVIAVDDCSSDATVKILNHYAERHHNMRVMVNPANIGFLRNFELALAYCRGQFIAPCDQDDVWHPEKIEALHNSIGSFPMVFCDSVLIDGSGELLERKMSEIFVMKDLRTPVEFVMTNCVSGHAMMFRRDLIHKSLPVPKRFFHDWWIAAVASANGGAIFVSRVLVSYRQHGSTVTDVLGTRKSKGISKSQKRSRERTEVGERVVALMALGGSGQKLLIEFSSLWKSRSSNWFCWGLVWFSLRNRNLLWGLVKSSSWWRIRRPFRYLLGSRWKTFISDIDFHVWRR